MMAKKSHLFRVINIVAHPEEEQNPETYVSAFMGVLANKFICSLSSTKANTPKGGIITKFEQLNPDLGEEVYIGQFSYGTYYGENASTFNSETFEKRSGEDLSSILYNPVEYTFWFHAGHHRVVIPKALPIDLFRRYLEEAFRSLTPPLEVTITPVCSRQVIDSIIESPDITKLEIVTHYTNNDNNEGFAELIDAENRRSRISSNKTILTADSNSRIRIQKKGYINSLLDLSRENGYAKAERKDEQGNNLPALSTKNTYEEVPILVGDLDRVQPSHITDVIKKSRGTETSDEQG